MADIKPNGDIEITRGNSLDLIIEPLYDDTGNPIVPTEGDELIVTVGYGDKALIRKTLNYEDYDREQEGFLLSLTADETDLTPYMYSYDCMYCFYDGRTASFPEVRVFEIVGGMSRKQVAADG